MPRIALDKPVTYTVAVVSFLLPLAASAEEDEVHWSKETPVLPSGWHVHDIDRPLPAVITPGVEPGAAPSDATVLFDGSDLDAWRGFKQTNRDKPRYNPDGAVRWKIDGNELECATTGDIATREAFGDCQLHIEWKAETPPRGESQDRSNSGVFFMGRYEVQVLDSFDNRTYADGSAASVYGQYPPLVNAMRPPGEWQVYDIIFTAPRFDGDRLVSPAYVTVFHNGVLVQNHRELIGPTVHKKTEGYRPHPARLPLRLQDHNNRTRFRNIWIRDLEREEPRGPATP